MFFMPLPGRAALRSGYFANHFMVENVKSNVVPSIPGGSNSAASQPRLLALARVRAALAAWSGELALHGQNSDVNREFSSLRWRYYVEICFGPPGATALAVTAHEFVAAVDALENDDDRATVVRQLFAMCVRNALDGRGSFNEPLLIAAVRFCITRTSVQARILTALHNTRTTLAWRLDAQSIPLADRGGVNERLSMGLRVTIEDRHGHHAFHLLHEDRQMALPPVLTLPPELLRHVGEYLCPADLASLHEAGPVFAGPVAILLARNQREAERHARRLLELSETTECVNVNQRNRLGLTPLHLAIRRGDVNAVRALLADRRTDVRSLPDVSMARAVLGLNDGDIDAENELPDFYGGYEPVHYAALKHDAEIIRLFRDLAPGRVDWNVKTKRVDWSTPIHLELADGHRFSLESLRLMLDVADPEGPSSSGYTPLQHVVLMGCNAFRSNHGNYYEQTVQAAAMFVRAGADCLRQDPTGSSPLEAALHVGALDLATAMLQVAELTPYEAIASWLNAWARSGQLPYNWASALWRACLLPPGRRPATIVGAAEAALGSIIRQIDALDDVQRVGLARYIHIQRNGRKAFLASGAFDDMQFERTVLGQFRTSEHKQVVDMLVRAPCHVSGRPLLRLALGISPPDVVVMFDGDRRCEIPTVAALSTLPPALLAGIFAQLPNRDLGALRKTGRHLHRATAEQWRYRLEHGWSLLHSAGAQGLESVVSFLLASGADVNARTRIAQTVLHLAIVRGRTDVVKLLLRQPGVAVNATDYRERTCLHLAASSERSDVAALLPSVLAHAGIAVNALDAHDRTPLHRIMQNHGEAAPAMLRALLRTTGLDINADGPGWTPLHALARNRAPHAPGMLDQLLQQPGINIHAPDEYGRTPICLIAANDSVTAAVMLARLLAVKDVHVNARDARGCTPIHLAMLQGTAESLAVLLEDSRTDRDALTAYGDNVLQVAFVQDARYGPNNTSGTWRQKVEVLVRLCDRQMLEARDSRGTILHILVRAAIAVQTVVDDVQSALELFLDAGVDPAARDSQGLTAADLLANAEEETLCLLDPLLTSRKRLRQWAWQDSDLMDDSRPAGLGIGQSGEVVTSKAQERSTRR